MGRFIRAAAVLIALTSFAQSASAQASTSEALADLQPNIQRLHGADKLIEEAIAAGKCPGAVLLVGRGDDVVWRKAYGYRSLEPQKTAMTADTIFDMASLTKPMATAVSILILSDRGKLNIYDKVARHIPEFAQSGKQDITIEQLLLHRGGLVPDNDISDYEHGPTEAWRNLYALERKWKPGTYFAYSDVGFIALGKLVEVVSGRTLDQFSQEEIYGPLGMNRTRFKPPQDWHSLCAPTEQRNGHWMIGEVHDPRAYALGGVAGHAGLFSTADDLSRFCRMLLHNGQLDGKRVLRESTVRAMTEPRRLADGSGCRGLGLDIDTPYSGCRGDRFEAGATFGHTGFTGTSFWVDPIHSCYVILLTNSVHPDGKGNVLKLRHEVATVVAEALLGDLPTTRPSTRPASASIAHAPDSPVLCGIDVLEGNNFVPLNGKRIALVTNHTGLDLNRNRTIDVLRAAKNIRLTRICSPEHGLYGLVDEKVPDSVDPQSGLRVYSLYGKTEKPSGQMLQDIDAIVYDIEDVGARYYTYTTTMGLCMQAAAEHKLAMFVLDRPNPVTGLIVDGPLADENDLGFTAFAPIPVSHGMTHGELARMFNDTRNIHCDLTVIPMSGWKRWMWFDDTGRAWTNPSPNMRNPTQALLYLGVGLLEASNVSVGRGTDQPFELFGAPWVEGRQLAVALNQADLPGLRFVAITFTPASSKFAGQVCQGCYITVTDRTAVEPVRAGLTIAWTLKHLFGDKFEIASVNKLMKNAAAQRLLATATDPAALNQSWREPLESFKRMRERYLLY